MSRCFPFPPPGYEKKPRIDDTDLSAKEKHKEKKRKKDKKDKEKRELKEKKDKDRSKEKHRDKKDRKEKHKDKYGDKDKEKNQNSDDKRVEGQPWFYNGEKSGSNRLLHNNEIKDPKYMQDLARRIKEGDGASGSQMVQKIAATDQRRAEPQGMAVESSIGYQSKEKEKLKDKNEDQRKVNGQTSHIDASGLEKAFGQILPGMDPERVEGIPKSVEKKDDEKQKEGKEKSKHKESDGRGDKHKGRDQEKSRKSKDKDRDKEKKKEEKAREIADPSKEQPKLKENGPKLKEVRKDSLDFRNIKQSDPLKLNSTSSAGEGSLGKRKEVEVNGYALDNGNRPNKFLRPPSSSHPVIENGRRLEPCQTMIQFASEKQGLANNHIVDFKDNKINGMVVAQQPRESSTNRPSDNVQANKNRETSAKPSHPDTKFLSQILSVPKMEDWPDSDDQEWLFSSNNLQSKKLNRSSSVVDGTQVWADALRLESADISALPYVIPY